MQFAGNEIGADGVRAIAEMLKGNKTLTSLCLASNRCRCCTICHVISGNDIGDNDAHIIADMLKTNNTLTSLDVSCMYYDTI